MSFNLLKVMCHQRTLFIFGAWLFVGLRVLHGLIHLTYNSVMHRLIPFSTSNVVLTAMWLGLFVDLAA